jgi:group I intron endonuclease
MAIIYRIFNKVSGKSYIGETLKDINFRWKKHLQVIKTGKGGCPALRDAIIKYGQDVFTINILIFCFDEDRYIYEKEYIKKYNTIVPNGYNILPGGEGGGFIGKKHTQESIEKIKNKLKLIYSSDEVRKLSSERSKIAMSNINIKERMNKSEKWNEYLKKLKLNKEKNNLNKKAKFNIVTYDQYNIILNEYKSIAEASRKTEISVSIIKYNLKKGCVGQHTIVFKKIFL